MPRADFAMPSPPLEITAADHGHQLVAEQWLAPAPDALFGFYADAANLERITPPWLKFEVLTPEPIDMRAGTMLDYRLVLHGVPVRWRSKITHWQPPHRFVDEQVNGPYQRWRHEHTFEPRDGGTLVRDHVTYRVPGGPLSPLIHNMLVRRDLRRIFAYRQHACATLLAPKGGQPHD